MTYIILAAGSGTRLHPITLKHPKALFSLDRSVTILGRMTTLLRRLDPQARLVIVTGFQKERIQQHITGITWVHNPFYEVTNSIASLWFAREFLDQEVTIINGDIVMSAKLIEDVVIRHTDRPCVLMDGSVQKDGDYNVQADQERVIVMSKALTNYSGEYAGVTKLDGDSAVRLKQKIEEMVGGGMYGYWYEDALVQMIFEENFELFVKDIAIYEWTEVDDVDDLMYAKAIHVKDGLTAG